MQINFAILLIIFHFQLLAQDLYPIKSNKKWGYINKEGKIVIEPQYDFAETFECGFGKVILKNKIGIINAEGKLVITPKEDEIDVVCPNYIIIKEDSAFGLDNTDGKNLIPAEYKQVTFIKEHFFELKNEKKIGFYNARNGKLIKPIFDNYFITDTSIVVSIFDKKGLYNISLNQILEIDNKQIEILNNVVLQKNKDFWAVLDLNGIPLSKPEFLSYKIINNNFLSLKAKTGGSLLFNIDQKIFVSKIPLDNYQIIDSKFIVTTKSNKHGVIDSTGKQILKESYTNIHLNENFFLVEQDGKWGLNDLSGNVIIPTIHNRLFPFKQSIAVFENNGLKGLINNKGEILISPTFANIEIDANSIYTTDNQGNKKSILIQQLINKNSKPKSKKPVIANVVNTDPNHIWIKGSLNRYGLLSHDTLLIEPKFDIIKADSKDFTLVGSKIDYRLTPKLFGYINSQQLSDNTLYKLGLVDKKSGKILIQPSLWHFDFDNFIEKGFAKIVFEEGKQGLYTSNRRIVKDYSYLSRERKPLTTSINYIGSFSDSVAPFCIQCKVNYEGDFNKTKIEGGSWGYITKSGKIIIDPIYEYAGEMVNSKAIVKQKGLFGLINQDGFFSIKPEYNEMQFVTGKEQSLLKVGIKKELFGLIKQDGNIVIDALYDKISTPKNGYSKYFKNGKYGFVNAEGKFLTQNIYDNVSDFSEGLAAVSINKMWGYIDTLGNQVVPISMPQASDYNEGLASFMKDGRIGYGDMNGKIAIAPKYFYGSPFKNGFAIVKDAYDKYAVIDKNANPILKFEYDEISFTNIPNLLKIKTENGFRLFDLGEMKYLSKKYFVQIYDFFQDWALVKFEDKFQYINSKGEFINNRKYVQASNFSNDVALVFDGAKQKILNKNGDEIVSNYKIISDFKNNRAFIEIAPKKFKLINRQLQEVSNATFYQISPFNNGIAKVMNQNKMFTYIDTNGVEITKMKFDLAKDFTENLAAVKKENKWGVINNKGELVSNFEFDYLSNFENRYAVFGLDLRFGLITTENEKITEIIYNDIKYIENGIIRLTLSNKVGYINPNGVFIYDVSQ